LLGNPSLLIFDEATSSLDTESERIIQKNLETICRDRSTIIIAHRLSTVRNADLILVLDKGVLIESGHHDQLMEKCGQYFYLNQQQLGTIGQ
jgi:ATP-binding cassette, subfamily B, bacterial HlyB/CyaB